MTNTMSLVRKLTEVMQEVTYIQKTGFNKFHGYKYATEADVSEKVRDELAKRNVLLVPSVKSHAVRNHTTSKGSTEYISTVQVDFTFIDGDSGESIGFTAFGEGQDAGDKGVYKAVTGAQKYALMKVFMIPTGDDPEENEEKIEIPNHLREKYVLAKGDLDGFYAWVDSCLIKGLSLTQMEQALTKKILEAKK